MSRLLLALLALLVFGAGPAQAVDPAPSSDPGASSPTTEPSTAASSSEAASAAVTWERVPHADGPSAREDHTWTVDADGRYAYLFGGRDGDRVLGDLWRFDLAVDAWERLKPHGATPAARFGHSAVWHPDEGLVIFAGQRGADFFGDLWAYDPDEDDWTKLPTPGAAPDARYGSCMVIGGDGRLRISHGFTFAGRFDDTRVYDPGRRRWTNATPDGRRPGERCLHDCFLSTTDRLVLYGGQDDEHVALGDLWTKRQDGSWRRLADPALPARRLYALAVTGDDAWIFGGAGRAGPALDDLWRVDRETLRFQRVRTVGPVPAARSAATLIHDPARGRLLLFGGMARNARSDVWALTDVPAALEPSPAATSETLASAVSPWPEA
jgi:N-acetylneuraminic acid mutarotase